MTQELHERSGFAHGLTVSGLAGIAAAMSVVVYQVLLRDPVLFGGRQVPPTWTSTVFITLLGGSLAVVFYATVLDEVLRGWFDIVTGAAVIGQWGVPIGIYLSSDAGISGLYGFAVILSGCLAVLAAVAILGNYVRRCWPAYGR